MPNTSIRFTEHQFKQIKVYSEQHGKSFSDAVRELVMRGLDEEKMLASLGVLEVNGLSRKVPLHHKQQLLITTKIFIMLRKIMEQNLKDDTPEEMSKNLNAMAVKYLNENVYT